MRDSEGYLTTEQFNHLISFANNERDKVLLTFLFETGRRVSEVVRCITPRDFNFQDGMVYFTILKRRTPVRKWVNVKPETIDMMRAFMSNMTEDEYVFPINRFRVDQILKAMAEKAGMNMVGKHKLHAHVLRHSYAILKVRKIIEKKGTFGMEDAMKLQDSLGHFDINSTLFYSKHFGKRDMKEFAEM